ncbi:MAG TPA: NUDIX hydrolase [Solirubrobacterales bacterium]|nr:NUDIX hydrolase [Solirubrobacterales bacterium]
MRVREDRIERADGSPGVYGVVDKSDYALVIPFDGEHYFLVEQFRYPVGARYWEFPQGSWEAESETSPEMLARAELAEETGLRAGELRHLGYLYGAYGFCSQGFDVFLATNCTEGAPARSQEEQGMKVRRFNTRDLEAMIRTGAIRDGASVAAYGLLQLD